MRWTVVGPTSQLAKWPPNSSDGRPLASNAAIASPLTTSTRPEPAAQTRRRCGFSATARPRLSHMARRMRSFSAALLVGKARLRLRRATREARRRGPMPRPRKPPSAEATPTGRQANTAMTATRPAASPPCEICRTAARQAAIHRLGRRSSDALSSSATASGGSDKRLPGGRWQPTAMLPDRPRQRNRQVGRSPSPALIEEEVDAQRLAALHGIALEIRDAGLAQHLLVDEEAAGLAAAVARQHDMRGIGHDLGRAPGLGRGA